MSLLTRYLTAANHTELSKRVTPNGMRLEDVICSGLRHPDSAIGVYAPDAQSYPVFHELFDSILEDFQTASPQAAHDLACLNPAAVVSTRIRVARNLAGHVFPAGMASPERLRVEEELLQACRSLAPGFEGELVQLKSLPPDVLADMVARRLAFGPDDKYMAAAGIHADWPLGRSVFNTHTPQLSIWINEEDHLRVAVVMPGACMSACHEVVVSVMSRLTTRLDFCEDAQRGFLTSCPSNAGSGMRISYMVDLRADASQQPLLEQLESDGIIEIRGAAGEHSPRSGGLVDVGFRNRVGVSPLRMLHDMERLFAAQELAA